MPLKLNMLKEPCINDEWLSGFTDAEGFSVKIPYAKNLHNVSLLFF